VANLSRYSPAFFISPLIKTLKIEPVDKGEIKPGKDQPKIWFDSLESMAQVLSTKNRELLKTIKDKNQNH